MTKHEQLRQALEDARTHLLKYTGGFAATNEEAALFKKIDSALKSDEPESGILGVAQAAWSAEEIAKIIDPFCAMALERERKWCDEHGKDFSAWASGYIARWEDALSRARNIMTFAAQPPAAPVETVRPDIREALEQSLDRLHGVEDYRLGKRAAIPSVQGAIELICAALSSPHPAPSRSSAETSE